MFSKLLGATRQVATKVWQGSLLQEIWRGGRPYLVKIGVDLLIAAGLWVSLFILRELSGWLPVGGWAGEFLLNLHAVAVLVSLVAFAFLSVIDIIQIRKGPRGA